MRILFGSILYLVDACVYLPGNRSGPSLPLPTLVCIAFASGIAAAWGGRIELRLSPRPALFTRSFAAYASFAALLLIPITIYFYVFHGDWFLLYLVDVATIPSAVAMLGFVVELAVGAAGFVVGSTLVRMQRDGSTLIASIGALVLGVGVPLAVPDRLMVVGTYAQFEGGFGLQAFGGGPLLQGGVVMAVLLFGGLAYLLGRLQLHGRRRT